jgi:hypothetical protein
MRGTLGGPNSRGSTWPTGITRSLPLVQGCPNSCEIRQVKIEGKTLSTAAVQNTEVGQSEAACLADLLGRENYLGEAPRKASAAPSASHPCSSGTHALLRPSLRFGVDSLSPKTNK